MEKELGLFPLNLVAFPGERLNLHIFEPRYKQLINDCLNRQAHFGIPSYVHNKIEYGTEVKITEVCKVYDDGRMDIKTIGLNPIEIVDFQNPWRDRLYSGGKVRVVHYDLREDKELKLRLIDLTRELFSWLNMEDHLGVDKYTSLHEIIHKIGLKPVEEYELLQMPSEKQRQIYIVEHLKRVLPALERAEKARDRITQNGHFKYLDPLKF